MAMVRTPRRRRPSTASAAWGLSRSETTSAPSRRPLRATCTTLPGRSTGWGAILWLCSRAALPASKVSPLAVVTCTPLLGTSVMAVTAASSGALSACCAARSTERAMGWLERLSARAATRSSSFLSTPAAGSTALTSNTPSVSVPVLSRAATRMSRRLSSTAPPLMRMPRREAAPMPPK